MAGRRPKPTNLKILTGNPGKRRLNDKEAKPTSSGQCPDWLSDVAKREWKRLATELETLGLLSNIDVAALAIYCENFARWRTAQEHLAEEGHVLTASNGSRYPSPWISISNGAVDRMKALLIEFGGTPAARSKVHAKPAGSDVDPFEDFLQRRNSQ